MSRTAIVAYTAALVAVAAWFSTLTFASAHVFGALSGKWAAPHPTAFAASVSAVTFWFSLSVSAFACSIVTD